MNSETLVLDGSSLTLADLVAVARNPQKKVACCPDAMRRVRRGWSHIEKIAQNYEDDFASFSRGAAEHPPIQDYGITTGFGEFKNIPIHPDELERLQQNLLLSHAVGVGENTEADDLSNYFPAATVRAALVIRLNAMLKGHSGVRAELVGTVESMLNNGIIPLVPLRGSIGSSGDLCPLAHLFVVLLGKGRFYQVRSVEDTKCPKPVFHSGSEFPRFVEGAVSGPSFKEGLALVNGATFSTAALALAVADAESLVNLCDVAVTMTLEAICGCARAFDSKIHQARAQQGQIDSARNVRAMAEGSRLIDRAGGVQDAYSVRCAPAVHGASRDAIAYAKMVTLREINAATDNPLFFTGEVDGELHACGPWDSHFKENWPAGYRGEARASYSAGNFHGQPVGLAADFLAIAVAELASISERRTQLLLDRHHNRNLPANLIPRRGVNSGLMLAQYSAAALVSENKILAHPSSVDSIPTSANSEDHVAMATTAARKVRGVLGNAQAVLAIEFLTAAQALEWRVGMKCDPLIAVEGEASDSSEVSQGEARSAWQEAEEEAQRFVEVTSEAKRVEMATQFGRGSRAAYLALRNLVAPIVEDRPLDEDLRLVRVMLESGSLLEAVEAALDEPLAAVAKLR